MPKKNGLQDLLVQQRKITEEVEKEISKLTSSNMVIENNDLQCELAKCKLRLEEADSKILKLTEENKNLQNSLYEKIYNEKLAVLNAVNKKVEFYYQANLSGEINRLKSFELESIKQINDITNTLLQERIEVQDEIYANLNELRENLNKKVISARTKIADKSVEYYKTQKEAYDKLHEEGITDAELKNAQKKHNIESLIGLNIINKLGILFLIIGAITATQYTYFMLPEIFKVVFMFLGGAVLLIVGEIINRKKANVFSLGITSGGIAILYIAIAVSYFSFDILSMYLALFLCVLITVISFYLSQRYHSQTIATFALIGGYLPLLAISDNRVLIHSAMVYFIILNLFSLVTTFRKKWSIATYTGFILNLLGTCYIMSQTLEGSDYTIIRTSDVVTIVYITLAFVIYTIIPLTSTYFNKKKMASYDIILLGFNTSISAILLYIAFFVTGFNDYQGLLAMIFVVIYFVLGKLIGVSLPEEKRVQTLFYITSFTFLVLMIPLQLKDIWYTLGWLVEGVVMVTYGIIKDEKRFKRYGYIVSSICLTSFLFEITWNDHYLTNKYTSITIGTLIIMGAYIYKKSMIRNEVKAFKYATYINLWFYMLFVVIVELSEILEKAMKGSSFTTDYLVQAICIIGSLSLAYLIPRIRKLSDNGMKIISMSIYGISILWLLILNSQKLHVILREITITERVISTSLILLISTISIIAMMDLVKYLVLDKKIGVEWYPLILSVYFAIILTQNLITQYDLEFTNFVISIIYVVLAFSWILFGFAKKYALIRRFGLGLSFMAIAKLFMIDLSFLSEGHRIISYFVFGFTFILISFLYQYFTKRIEG